MTNYEWDYETIDLNSGDIIDHNHANKLTDFRAEDKTDTLVLIRDSGDQIHGLQERTWAYVINNKLPEYFSDSTGIPLHKVPARFHKELADYINSIT
jgi:hypothetical protein